MKILITGGSGFIGSHLVDALLNEGNEVLIYDIESPRFDQRCGYAKGDVTELETLIKSSEGFDIIYHLAAEANVNRFYENPVFSDLITSHSTINVLECARRNNVGRVLLASTEWIYGSIEGDEKDFISEGTPYAQNPDHLYTSSKIAAELYCKNYYTLYGVNYTIMRYGIPFGERARPETVTPIFIKKMMNNEEITVHGDGSQTRQFIYVQDLAEGNAACLKPEAENQIFNINGSEKITVLGIVKTLEEILNKKAKIKFIADRKGNYKGRFISSDKAKRLLGWEPKWRYRQAMKKYVIETMK
ncbi:MAG: NAD-dependent epimerase/dehydratase family protein [Ignavibacteria bacterium]|jgi:UDP-glucose 4-epimerase